MTLSQHRAWADSIGGEVGRKVNSILDELETAKQQARGRELPPLLGSKEVADLLGISSKNIPHTRKTKLFPEPDLMVGTRPFWFQTTIEDYREIKERRSQRRN